MAIEKKIFLISFFITSLIFIVILASNSLMNNGREQAVLGQMYHLLKNYEEMQSLLLMSEYFGEDASCNALSSMLSSMNTELWELGLRIDSYRQVTEEFLKDPFYLEQKEKFNRKEILYFTMFRKMKDICNTNQTIVSYFYRKKDFCPDCDAQAFVLEDLRKSIEKDGNSTLALFSFDADFDIPTFNILLDYYNITSFPCLVIEDQRYCGLYDKDNLTSILCKQGNICT